ncbi:MAG: ankyrin repeat domain-containing protein [Acidobacteria bacterium]|nr:ankyrin repeat domain-containing protein [Acidobacteriota bacterium]
MSDLKLIEAVKAGDLPAVNELIEAGADPNQQDEHGWTPLNWAAGKGDASLLKSLLERGADLSRVGRDERTPYMIALAAGHAEAARLLRDAGAKSSADQERPYCKAVVLKEVRRFSGWVEGRINWKESSDEERPEGGPDALADDEVVFLHQDFTVTRSMWPGENVIFNNVTPEWQKFCRDELDFNPPDDLDLLAAAHEESVN